jgi:hypothetical protein
MTDGERLPERSSARARWQVALLVLRALAQVVLMVPRLVREMFCAPARRRAMTELLRESAERTSPVRSRAGESPR